MQQDIFDLLLHNIMPVDVRQVSNRVDLEPQFHLRPRLALRGNARLLPRHDFNLARCPRRR
jgi:hypothetical protein